MSSEEASRRISEAAEQGVTTLSLGNLRLGDEMPESLGQLNQLTELKLNGNQMTAVPESVRQLTNLTTLSLASNQLQALPEWLGQLTQLTDLNLMMNELTSLPDSLAGLTQLTQLNLFENQLSSVPEWLGQLPGLTELALAGNPLPLTMVKAAVANGALGLRDWFEQDHEPDSEAEAGTRLSQRVLDLIAMHGGRCATPSGDLKTVMSSIDFSRVLLDEVGLDFVSYQQAHEFLTVNEDLRGVDRGALESLVWEFIGEKYRGVRFDANNTLDPYDWVSPAKWCR